MRIAFNTLFSTEASLEAIQSFFQSIDLPFKLENEVDAEFSLTPLHLLPSDRNVDHYAFCLLPMLERRNFLAIRNDEVNSDDRIGLKNNALILASKLFVSDKILTIKQNLIFKQHGSEIVMDKVRKNEAKNAIIEGCFVDERVTANYHLVELDSREFGHAPGQGFLALTGPEHHPLRSLLRSANCRTDLAVCNIERKMAKLSDATVNNHCEMDHNENFHLWAFSSKGETHISQSTRHEIEERALENMRN